jgi:DNA-binding MarR family transcriptional regulator
MSRPWEHYNSLRLDVLSYIDAHVGRFAYPPAQTEIAYIFGRSKAWASEMTDRMEQDGLLVRDRSEGRTKSRTIRLTPAGTNLLEVNRGR